MIVETGREDAAGVGGGDVDSQIPSMALRLRKRRVP